MECLVYSSVKKPGVSIRDLVRVADLALIEIKKKKMSISLHLVGEQKIRALNKFYRQKDKSTDVLSFAAGEGDMFPGTNDEAGDIFICIPVIKRQAKKYGITYKEELYRMIIHGILHLFGYDHEKSEKDEKIMFKLQEKILQKSLSKK